MRAALAAVGGGIVAVGSKELRGRMRGPRAFIALTFYLALLAGFTVMVYLIQRQLAASQAAFGGGNPYLSAQVGQTVFATLLLLQTLLVLFLAPAATSGAISLEREKQTLDLLAATPVSTLAIVVGKLASALAFVVVLVLASIPLTAVVFVFGGVAPEDVLRGYLVLLATAVGFGAVGLFFSSLTRRTQSATVVTYLAVLVLVVGTAFVWFFWDQMAGQRQQAVPARDANGVVASESTPGSIPRPPEALLWLNPVVAAADVICGTDVNPYSLACQLIGSVTGTTPGTGVIVQELPVPPGVLPAKGGMVEPGIAVDATGWQAVAANDVVGPVGVAADPAGTSTSTRDTYWPRSAAALLLTAGLLVLLAVQLVSPTRRWRIFRRRPRREAQP
jgi:ABC-type transport system involved in multi-copper enzyme maturation permease subunit